MQDQTITCMERRLRMMVFLSRVRITHIEELCQIFSVSRTTIQKDLQFLEEYLLVPLATQSGRQGYISVDGKWSLYVKYLKPRQQEVILKAYRGEELDNDDRKVLITILKDFGYPNMD